MDPESEPDKTINIDIASGTSQAHRSEGGSCQVRPAVQPAHRRGIRIMADNASLMSSAVYMDVSVVGEIQTIGDPDRGSAWINAAWTNIVLGPLEREIHFCLGGDGGANHSEHPPSQRYVQESSLDGGLSLIQKGDCESSYSGGTGYSRLRARSRREPVCATQSPMVDYHPRFDSSRPCSSTTPGADTTLTVTQSELDSTCTYVLNEAYMVHSLMCCVLQIKRVVFETLPKY
jgi:hypothetical protein